MPLPENETPSLPKTKVTARPWLEDYMLYFFGWAYMILNLWLFIDYLFVNIQLALWLVGMPGSLLIYYLYFKSQKEKPNPQATKFTFIFPGIFWFFAMLFYVLALASPTNHYGDLVIVYTIHLVFSGSLYLYSKTPQGMHQWMEAHRLYFIGGLYVLFHIWFSFEFIRNNLNFRDGLTTIGLTNLSTTFLVIVGLPASLLIGIFSVKSVRTNRKSARYILLLPIIFGIVTFALYPDLYFGALWVYFLVQFTAGVIFFISFSGDGAEEQ